MTDSVECSCGRRVPVLRNPTYVRGPLTPDEELIARAKSWAVGSRFAEAEPVVAELLRELIDALEGHERERSMT